MLGKANFPEGIGVLMLLQTPLGSHTPCQVPGVSVSLVQPPQTVLPILLENGYGRRAGKQQGTLFAPCPAYARIILRPKESSAQA